MSGQGRTSEASNLDPPAAESDNTRSAAAEAGETDMLEWVKLKL